MYVLHSKWVKQTIIYNTQLLYLVNSKYEQSKKLVVILTCHSIIVFKLLELILGSMMLVK